MAKQKCVCVCVFVCVCVCAELTPLGTKQIDSDGNVMDSDVEDMWASYQKP